MTPETPNGIRSDIEDELENLEKLVEELNTLQDERSDPPDQTQLRAIAGILHDYYTGLERIFEMIARRVDLDLPDGGSWHHRLLKRMTVEIDGVRPRVIGDSLSSTLKDFLDFRHLFRHTYGFDLNWERFRFLAEQLEETHDRVVESLTDVQEFLSKLNPEGRNT